MKIPRLTKRGWAGVLAVLVAYGASYYLARTSYFLIHRVSHAGDTYYHSIDTSGYHSWTFIGIGEPVCYYVFTPLRWLEAFAWRFIPREYVFTNHAA